MKKVKFSLLGMLALTLGLVFAGCVTDGSGGNDDPDVLDGTTWVGKGFDYDSGPYESQYAISFNSPDLLMVREDGGNIVKGTYSVSGGNITFTITSQWDVKGAKWNPATGSYLPQTGTFTDAELTIVFTPGDSLVYLPASTITITGLESHNGKYCWGWGYIDDVDILAGSSGTYWNDDGDNWAPGVLIVNGSVTLILQYWGGDVGEDHPYLVGGEGWIPFSLFDFSGNFNFWIATSEDNLNDSGTGGDIQIKFSDGMGKGMFKN
jgi:hypothetical protein